MTSESRDNDLVARMRDLYMTHSKHGNYHPIPESLRHYFPDLDVDPKWRDPRPRFALLTSVLDASQDHGPIVELGANTGYQTLELAARYPTSEVIALEVNGLHAEFVRLAAQLAGLQNVTTIEGSFTPSQIAHRWPGASVLDFNVVHHAGSDFSLLGVKDVNTWWEFGLTNWLKPVREFGDYWFSSGYRMGGQHALELHDPDDPEGFVRRIIDALPAELRSNVTIWMAGPSPEGIRYQCVDHASDDLGSIVASAERTSLYRGEYFKRPIFRFRY